MSLILRRSFGFGRRTEETLPLWWTLASSKPGSHSFMLFMRSGSIRKRSLRSAGARRGVQAHAAKAIRVGRGDVVVGDGPEL